MDSEKYNAFKLRKIIDTTLSNYANMIKRLERKKSISEIILIYYSIFLIIVTLTGKYYSCYFNVTMSEYFSIILSIVVLTYSLINKNANYSSRITDILDSLNALKTIKRELNDSSLDEYHKHYNEIADKTERRSDVDFFVTVKHLCKEYNISWITKKSKNSKSKTINEEIDVKSDVEKMQEKVVNNYISEINILCEEGKIIFGIIWEVFIFLIPPTIFILCIILKI